MERISIDNKVYVYRLHFMSNNRHASVILITVFIVLPIAVFLFLFIWFGKLVTPTTEEYESHTTHVYPVSINKTVFVNNWDCGFDCDFTTTVYMNETMSSGKIKKRTLFRVKVFVILSLQMSPKTLQPYVQYKEMQVAVHMVGDRVQY